MSTLRSTKASSRASRSPRWCKLQTRKITEATFRDKVCLHAASSQFISAGDKLKFLLVTCRNTTLIWKCTRICYCNIHLFVTHFNQENSLTRLLYSQSGYICLVSHKIFFRLLSSATDKVNGTTVVDLPLNKLRGTFLAGNRQISASVSHQLRVMYRIRYRRTIWQPQAHHTLAKYKTQTRTSFAIVHTYLDSSPAKQAAACIATREGW